MSWMQRIANVFRTEKLDRDIDEELASHMDEARADGRDARDARRALGSPLKLRDEMHDAHVVAWLDSLRSDAIYGWRRLAKSKVTTAAAVVSLGLAIGACTAAFRLVDALLLAPLPVKAPHELYSIGRLGIGPEGKPQLSESWDYPLFLKMRDAVKGDATLLAISFAGSYNDLTYSTDDAMEKAQVQFVSAEMFDCFGLRPEAGRLLTAADDDKPLAHPYAVISDRYWTSRFGRDPRAIGQTFQFDNKVIEIVGVVAPPFTGTEAGKMFEIFLPMSMSDFVANANDQWFRIFARVPEGRSPERIRAEMDPVVYATRADEMKASASMPEQAKRDFMAQKLVMRSAATGISDFRDDNRASLFALSVLVALVLLIACANVANLMTSQAAARERELALRVSIGGGRRRLVQLVLVESALIGLGASLLGAVFAWWAAPFVIAMNSRPYAPVQLALPADWRVFAFAAALAIFVTMVFGLAPAIRASKIDPSSTLKGGSDPGARRRTMNSLIAVQVAFCFLVVFVSGMFVASFQRLSRKPIGFSAERVLTLDITSNEKRPPETWEAMADQVRRFPGVQSASLASFPLMFETSWNDSIGFNGGPPSDTLSYFLHISPEWPDTMKVPIDEGRTLRAGADGANEALVNHEFVKTFFHGQDPVGKNFEDVGDNGVRRTFTVTAVVGDSCYRDLRECVLPVAYLSIQAADPYHADGGGIRYAVVLVKTATENPASMGPTLRQVVANSHSGLRVSNVRTQQSINDVMTMGDRMLAILAMFFATVALVLAAVGLCGVLNYSVVQRQREIGVRIAVGARGVHIARSIVARTAVMVLAGAVAGIGVGLAASRFFTALLYNVKPTDVRSLVVPLAAILVAAILAALPAVIRAVHIDPVILLRSE